MASLAVAGCRATVAEQPADLLPPPDLAFIPVAPADLSQDDAGPDMFVCTKGPNEICDDGCDNDGNTYVDGDDPACTAQLLVTSTYTAPDGGTTGTPKLWRLILDDAPHVEAIDDNAVPPFAMATYNAKFSPNKFLLLLNGELDTLLPPPLNGTGPLLNTLVFHTRDVCTFNGELIVLEPRSLPTVSTLHRFQADGMTEIFPSVTMTGVASACASDGEQLYVAFYQVPTPSRIEVFTKGGANGPVDTGFANSVPMPPALVTSCCDRLIDFAFVKKGSGGLIGLFANGGGGSVGDNSLTGTVMAPFALDGGVGPPLDAGIWNGVGEFLP